MAFWILPVVIFILVAGFVGLWMWTVFLETARPASVRFILHGLLFAISCGEVFIWYRGFFKWFVILPALFASFWGPFDAILRYPVVHDMDSFFTLKIILLVAGKTMLLVCGFHNLGKNAGLFLLCLFLCVWCIPLLYELQVRHGASNRGHKDDVREKRLSRHGHFAKDLPRFLRARGQQRDSVGSIREPAEPPRRRCPDSRTGSSRHRSLPRKAQPHIRKVTAQTGRARNIAHSRFSFFFLFNCAALIAVAAGTPPRLISFPDTNAERT
ncbi:unnamed protein product [Amoebophrya sp. A120]|nr:unnamed protein product [Amoebophrya sp. A120]|eukprot:GSA120T00004589001.1